MTTTRPGDIILVCYPYTNLQDCKKRPAMVVSSSEHNRSSGQCVVIPITSSVHRALEDREVLIDGSERVQTGLYKTSIAKAGILFTIESPMILKSIGSAPQGLLRRTVTEVLKVFPTWSD